MINVASKRIDINYERERRKRLKRTYTVAIVTLIAIAIVLVVYATGGYEKLLSILGLKGDVFVEAKGNIIEYSPKGESVVAAVNGTIIVCDENGVTGLDETGKWKWNSFFEFNNPFIEPY